MDIPRLVIAAPMSGSGKTTLVAGMISALVARGLHIAPFKVGPDYIDTTYHALAAGRPCRNLDAWMLPAERIRTLFAHGAAGADLALVEGVMGLFDGLSGRDDTGSTAHIARLLDAPVLLVLDASAMARSAAAIVQGIRDFDPRIQLAGVLLNRVGSEAHARMVTEAIESEVGVPVVGHLLQDDALNLPERHLGLVPTLEPGRWRAWLDSARERIEGTVDLDHVVQIARAAPPLLTSTAVLSVAQRVDPPPRRAVIAVARDAAFSFIYQDNLDLLRDAGADIAFFSPLTDQQLPSGTQGLYLGGGFPELYTAELAANAGLHTELRAAFRAGLPIYAECGGLMYLTEEIVDQAGTPHSMVGLVPGRSVMTGRLTLGYRTVRARGNSWLWRAGETMRGHEFHFSSWEYSLADAARAYDLLPDEFQKASRPEGALIGTLFASYVHLHFLACPILAERFVETASSISPLGGHP